ncbi:egg case protein variant 1 [Nephila pilipes]|uniref:Egg case protein variant 1 n=1 Tax=Nephila pilipes TaxID=299642 RepID=A0A8X6PEQ4_NEPPI|nr:egg case protein variant 1 [Nephila pilipes]
MDISFAAITLLVFVFGIQLAKGGGPSGDDCLKKCKFTTPCKVMKYIQSSPCSYTCICDGRYTYFDEFNFKRCGSNKRCYQGNCVKEVPYNCQYIYGGYFIGLRDPYNSCRYNCHHVFLSCYTYEEHFQNGQICYTYYNIIGNNEVEYDIGIGDCICIVKFRSHLCSITLVKEDMNIISGQVFLMRRNANSV